MNPTADFDSSRRWKMKKYVSRIILAIGAFLVIQGFLMHAISPGARCDLDILLEAGKRYASNQAVYRLEDLNEHTKPPLLTPLLGMLAALPREPVRIFWDLMNLLLPFVVLGLWQGVAGTRLRWTDTRLWTAAAGALLLLRGAWRAEMDLGQYNLLTLTLTLAAWRLVRRDGWTMAGGLALLSLLLKPTQLFLIPWILLAHPDRPAAGQLRRFALGSLILVLLLAGLDALHQPIGKLLEAGSDWLHFLPHSSQKHILRWDNFGIPSVLEIGRAHV